MRNEAAQFYRAALAGFSHAREHLPSRSTEDAAQVVLSLHLGTEMLLKAITLNRGVSIMRRAKESKSLGDLLKEGSVKNAALIEVLMVKRDNIQHFANYIDTTEAQELYESVMAFVVDVVETELSETLPKDLKPILYEVPLVGVCQIVASENLQRDLDAGPGVVVWAQGAGSQLAVHMLRKGERSVRLTPADGFEYMPRTDGSTVTCYRQRGGVVLYDVRSAERTVISETGGPGAVRGDWIAAQGLGIADGLGGGVWLFNRDSQRWEQLSDNGDSPRLTDELVIWPEFNGETMVVRGRPIAGGEITDLVVGGAHPSPSGDVIAWTEWNAQPPTLHVTRVDGTELYTAPNAVFPCLDGDLVAFLRPDADGGHSLIVDDIRLGRTVFELPGVGFPVGNGPCILDGVVYFESRSQDAVHSIWVTEGTVRGD